VFKIKDILCSKVDEIRDFIINTGQEIFKNPELGFKEFNTLNLIKEIFDSLGLSYESEISVTGIKCKIGSGNGPNIGLIAELDGVPTLGHKYSGEDLGVAHSCGHSNQVAIMLGVIKLLVECNFFDKYDGSVTFIGTPAEEFTDLEYRSKLVEKNEIKYMSGKQDMIYKGVFDDVDLALSCHTMGSKAEPSADVNSSLNGFIHKIVKYHGKAAHAGACPHLGVNALNAAVIGLTAVNAQRETFIDDHNIRVHGIIKNGGHTVNTVPEEVEIEAYVRGNDIVSLLEANSRVNRAFEAGAYAVGGTIDIIDTNGYVPFKQDQKLSQLVKGNLSAFVKKDNLYDGVKSMASGDIGDLSVFLPTIQFGFSGFVGSVHGSDFDISDNDMAYIVPTKVVLMTIVDLLDENACKSNEIINEFVPVMSREEYFEKWLKAND
jgi:amidohydrolase